MHVLERQRADVVAVSLLYESRFREGGAPHSRIRISTTPHVRYNVSATCDTLQMAQRSKWTAHAQRSLAGFTANVCCILRLMVVSCAYMKWGRHNNAAFETEADPYYLLILLRAECNLFNFFALKPLRWAAKMSYVYLASSLSFSFGGHALILKIS